MEGLTTREAAEVIGCSVQSWHRLVAKHQLKPMRELPGVRGAKFWRRSDVRRVAATVRRDRAAAGVS